VVGAGLSGIGAACQLTAAFPERTVAVLESREASGGTWDLFRYPGVRSDSDMFTFGYRWRPWPSDTALADGHLILEYVRTVAREYGVDELIRYRHTVTSADFDTASARWTVQVDTPDGPTTLTADVLWGCTGYYDYDQGHRPAFPGEEQFTGQIVHPQFWPEDLDYAGKNVVVIGSGATAVTLVPSMAPTAGHVTMLQRTPTYIVPQPDRDAVARRLSFLPYKAIYPVVRWKNVVRLVGVYQLSQRFPQQMKGVFRRLTEPMLPDTVDYAEHFQPSYDPWDQRLCVVPNGDLFKALRSGKASVVTDTIDTFTATGIRTSSGEEL
jgi:cation diffusion facilitator CzcD-associated flavoprotein CzcO